MKPHSSKDLSGELKKIYGAESVAGGFKIIKRRGRKFFLALFGFLIVVLALATLSFYIFPEPASSPIKLTLLAPKKQPAGAEIHYRLKLENQENAPAKQISVKANFPSQFYFFRSTPPPASSTNQTWTFLSIPAHGEVVVDIFGQLLGEIGEQKAVEMVVRYQPPGYSFLDEQKISAETLINEEGVSVWVGGPEQIVAGQEIKLEVHYKNDSKQTFSPVQLELVPPASWVLTKADPVGQRQSTLWPLGELAVGQEGMVTVKGMINSVTSGALQEWRWSLVRVVGQTRDVLVEKSHLVLVKDTDQDLSLKIVGGSTEATYLPNQPLNLVITYNNSIEQDVENNVVELYMSGFDGKAQVSGIGLSSVEKNVSLGYSAEPVARWSKIEVPTLQLLPSGAGGELTAQITLPPTINVPVKLEARWARAGENIVSKTLILKPVSQAVFNQSIVYLNKAKQEVPASDFSLRAGVESNYRAHWEISNGETPLNEVTIKTILPDNVRWLSESSVTAGEKLQYDSKTRQVTWKLGWLPSKIGSQYGATKLTAEFLLAVKPKKATDVVLLSASNLEGKDSVSAQGITIISGEIKR